MQRRCDAGGVKKQSDRPVEVSSLRSSSVAWKTWKGGPRALADPGCKAIHCNHSKRAVDLGRTKLSELLYVAARGMPQITA